MTVKELDELRQEVQTLREQVARLGQQLEQKPTDSAEPSSSTATPQAPTQNIPGRVRHRYRETISRTRAHPYYSLAILLVLAGLGFGADLLWNYMQSYESTTDAEISGNISPISAEVPGTVTRVLVQNGQWVRASQSLVELDPQPYRLAAEAARARFEAAKAEADIARGEGRTSNAPLLGGSAREIKGAAQVVKLAAVDSAEAALDGALLKLKNTTIAAPASGIIAERSVNIGERVAPSQRLMAEVQTVRLWITARFKETQLRRLHRGQLATIHVDALGRDYHGFLASIAPATTSQFSLLPAENTTGNYVKVVQRIAVRVEFKPAQDLSSLRPGMSVEPTVWVK